MSFRILEDTETKAARRKRSKIRRIRTPEGEKKYHGKIGDIIGRIGKLPNLRDAGDVEGADEGYKVDSRDGKKKYEVVWDTDDDGSNGVWVVLTAPAKGQEWGRPLKNFKDEDDALEWLNDRHAPKAATPAKKAPSLPAKKAPAKAKLPAKKAPAKNVRTQVQDLIDNGMGMSASTVSTTRGDSKDKSNDAEYAAQLNSTMRLPKGRARVIFPDGTFKDRRTDNTYSHAVIAGMGTDFDLVSMHATEGLARAAARRKSNARVVPVHMGKDKEAAPAAKAPDHKLTAAAYGELQFFKETSEESQIPSGVELDGRGGVTITDPDAARSLLTAASDILDNQIEHETGHGRAQKRRIKEAFDKILASLPPSTQQTRKARVNGFTPEQVKPSTANAPRTDSNWAKITGPGATFVSDSEARKAMSEGKRVYGLSDGQIVRLHTPDAIGKYRPTRMWTMDTDAATVAGRSNSSNATGDPRAREMNARMIQQLGNLSDADLGTALESQRRRSGQHYTPEVAEMHAELLAAMEAEQDRRKSGPLTREQYWESRVQEAMARGYPRSRVESALDRTVMDQSWWDASWKQLLALNASGGKLDAAWLDSLDDAQWSRVAKDFPGLFPPGYVRSRRLPFNGNDEDRAMQARPAGVVNPPRAPGRNTSFTPRDDWRTLTSELMTAVADDRKMVNRVRKLLQDYNGGKISDAMLAAELDNVADDLPTDIARELRTIISELRQIKSSGIIVETKDDTAAEVAARVGARVAKLKAKYEKGKRMLERGETTDDEKKPKSDGKRRVATQTGADRYGKPIGSVIGSTGKGHKDTSEARESRLNASQALRAEIRKNTPRPGDTGAPVRYLQDMLEQGGFGDFELDGIYGPKTIEAVKKVQKEMGVEPDGTATPELIKKLANYIGKPATKTIVMSTTEFKGLFSFTD